MKSWLGIFTSFILVWSLYASAEPHCNLVARNPFTALLVSEIQKSHPENSATLNNIFQRSKQIAAPLPENTKRIFYPFGGIDLFSAVKASEGVTEIYSVQLLPFGNLNRALQVTPQESTRMFELLDLQTHGMLSSNQLREIADTLSGLGAFGIYEAEHLLKADVLDVKYLDFVQGKWVEIEPDPNDSRVYDHGKISLSYEGRTIQYHLLRANLSDRPVIGISDQAYQREQHLASQLNVGIPETQMLLGDRPFSSMLKAIHQGTGILRSEFKSLTQIIDQSESIFIDQGTARPNDFPGYPVESPETLTIGAYSFSVLKPHR